jgi:WD40 repeat protein
MWRHLKVDKGLLLATGHQNGNIKVWDCNTGKNIYQVFFNRIDDEVRFVLDQQA